MATKVKVKPIGLEDPKWSVAQAKPGDEVELSVTAKALGMGQSVEFLIRDERGGLVDIVRKPTAAGDVQKAKWVAPNSAGTVKLTFDAVLRETPSPKNGHITSRGRVTSGALSVHGFKVSITSVDAAFAPHSEALHVGFNVENGGGLPLKGRYEVWGERYPGGPLYTKDFTPATGGTTWNTWNGSASAGPLNGKFISPEFSPYRVRVVIGIDDASVKDPMGAGRGKVCVAERQFEVVFAAVVLRLQAGLPAAVQDDLRSFLAVENPGGSLGKATGRFADAGETGRFRLPCKRHQGKGEALNQGSSIGLGGIRRHHISDPYMSDDHAPLPIVRGRTKHQIDATVYSRPEIPLEFEARLMSRDPAKNKAKPAGVFDALAIGPATFDVAVEDTYFDAFYTPATPEATFLRNAAHSVKRGTDTAPFAAGATPEITYWQERFQLAADGVRDIATTQAFVVGKKELTVYINRTKLELGADKDYTEVSAHGLKLKADFTKRGDVVWVMRVPDGPHGPPIANWVSFPPGDNCHGHYGGIRGKTRNPELLDAFSAAPSGSEPIIGKGGAFPYSASITLRPNGATSERVESKALTAAGPSQGLAGIILSPSVVAGDSYALEVGLGAAPYERSMGATPRGPRRRVKTGPMTVWRVHTISGSFKLPAKGTMGLLPSVGIDDPPLAGRADPGDGTGMMVSTLNSVLKAAFCEWHVPVPAAPIAPREPHQNVDLATYIISHNAQNASLGLSGFPALAGIGGVSNSFVQWDHYRDALPPGVPANRVNAVSNAIAALAPGMDPTAAAGTAQGAITAQDNAINPLTGAAGGPAGPDAVLGVGIAAIPVHGGVGAPVTPASLKAHLDWVKGFALEAAGAHLDRITPGVVPPKTMTTVRWPKLCGAWLDGTPGAMVIGTVGVAGFSAGDGQSFFATDPGAGNPDTFEHEMGHSVHLAHFVTGGNANSCWKHHDHGHPGCKMGYNNRPVAGFYVVPLPAVPKGPAININTGARSTFCAKCLLKMRGWNEFVLPCNWAHPDVF